MKIMYRNNMMMNKVNPMRINDNLMDGLIKIKIRIKNNSKELLWKIKGFKILLIILILADLYHIIILILLFIIFYSINI